MTTKLYHDLRDADGFDPKKPYPVKIAINHHGNSAYLPTGIKVLKSEWDKKRGIVVNNPLKGRYNILLGDKKLQVDKKIDEMRIAGKLKGLPLSDIRRLLLSEISDSEAGGKEQLLVRRIEVYGERAEREATRVYYRITANKVREFCRDWERLTFDDITTDWLSDFDKWMSGSVKSVNGRNIHLRNLRAVFNDAVNDNITSNYPFRKYKIKAEPTRDRSLSAETLRAIFNFECEPWQKEYQDIFKLIFLLCGINMGDLANLKEIRNGRIEYKRLKTGQPCSVKVIPEALAIIRQYKGDKYLLNINDRYGDYRVYLHRFNEGLKHIGIHYNPCTKKNEGEAICPDISSYFARYSWATIATELDIPERTIAAALGHSTASVTNIYMRADMRKKVDDANRKIVDYVLMEE